MFIIFGECQKAHKRVIQEDLKALEEGLNSVVQMKRETTLSKFKTSVFCSDISAFENIFGQDRDVTAWKALFAACFQVANIVATHLPDFISLMCNYIEKKSEIVIGSF